jgi:hypothetical protein
LMASPRTAPKGRGVISMSAGTVTGSSLEVMVCPSCQKSR